MKKFCLDLTVQSIESLSDKHVLIKLTQDAPLPKMLPGQFVEARIDHSPNTFLRRPISINFVDTKRNELWLLVAIVGKGTHQLAQLKAGEILNLVFPLGNSFSNIRDVLAPSQTSGSANTAQDNGCSSSIPKVLLVGGGVGVAPLLYQGKLIKEEGGEPVFLLGARSARDLIELDLFKEVGTVHVTTEDHSEGEKGFVTNHPILKQERFDFIQTCGPKPMMMAVARYAKESGTPCEVSLENMMACGLGACLCCVEKTIEGNLCVCKEGPVFNIKKLLW